MIVICFSMVVWNLYPMIIFFGVLMHLGVSYVYCLFSVGNGPSFVFYNREGTVACLKFQQFFGCLVDFFFIREYGALQYRIESDRGKC